MTNEFSPRNVPDAPSYCNAVVQILSDDPEMNRKDQNFSHCPEAETGKKCAKRYYDSFFPKERAEVIEEQCAIDLTN